MVFNLDTLDISFDYMIKTAYIQTITILYKYFYI